MSQVTQDDYRGATSGDSGNGAELSASKIRERWDQSHKATVKERQAYWVNSSFLGGEQWVTWDIRGNVLVEMPREGDRLRLTENRLWPSVRTLVAKLLKRPLVFEVPPTSADDASQAGSRMGEAVLSDVHHRHNWEELRRQCAWATLKGGVAALCVEWDAKAGTDLGVSETGKNFGTGDTCEAVLSVAEIATEPGCRDIEHAHWWIKGSALPPKQVQEMYGLDTEPGTDANVGLSPLQRKLTASDGAGGSDTKLTLVLTHFERPAKGTKGSVKVVVGGKIVEQGSWPFPFKDRLNVVAVRETPHDTDWLGDTILSAAVSPQHALNHSISKIGEHMKLAGDAKFAIPDTAGDEWDDLSDVPEVVRYYGQQSPEWVAPPSMPAWWMTYPDRCKGAIDDILGVHDISRGDSPSNVTSGIALSLLAEQDDTPLGLLSKEMAEAWGRLASLVLRVYEDKVDESREARVERPGQAPERVTWSGKDLAGQTTAVVPLEAVKPTSDAALQALAFQLKSAFPEMDLKTFARIANLPATEDLTEVVDPAVAKARRENGEMAAGNIVIPAEFDPDEVHGPEHETFMMSARYEALDEDTQAIFEAHLSGHEVNSARKMGEQLARATQNPALAGAWRRGSPPLAGSPGAALDAQGAQAAGVASAPKPASMDDIDSAPAGGG